MKNPVTIVSFTKQYILKEIQYLDFPGVRSDISSK